MNLKKWVSFFTIVLMVGMTLGIASAAERIEVYDYNGMDQRQKINYTLIDEGNFTELMVTANTNKWAGGIPGDIKMKILSAGTQVWARAFNTTNDAEIRFFVGIHEYVEYI